MTLSIPDSAMVKQYLPGLYFIAVATWIGFDNQNIWALLVVLAFIAQMTLNNRYLSLVLGTLMIGWSVYMAFVMYMGIVHTAQFISIAVVFTIANLYISRMLFLNQNFLMAALRENSLDETLFI